MCASFGTKLGTAPKNVGITCDCWGVCIVGEVKVGFVEVKVGIFVGGIVGCCTGIENCDTFVEICDGIVEWGT